MRRTNESEKLIERRLFEGVRDRGGLCIKLLSDYYTGLPDRLCLLPGGKVAFVELKTTGKRPRKIQASVHSRLRALDFRVEVIDTLEGVNEFIRSIHDVEQG